MWRPDEVVPQHKRRAAVLWVLLIFSIFTYAIYLYIETSAKARNPATFSVVSNEVYRYPDVWMCLYNYNGCDGTHLEEECVASANNTEGGSVKAVYYPGGEKEQNISTYYTLTVERSWCVVFKTSEVVAELGNSREHSNYLDVVFLELYWYPGGKANNSSTCISEDGDWEDHRVDFSQTVVRIRRRDFVHSRDASTCLDSFWLVCTTGLPQTLQCEVACIAESIFAFLRDTEFGNVSPGVLVPYTCMTNESTINTYTRMGIGLTKKLRLDSSNNENLYEGMLSSSTHKIKRTAEITGIQAPYAHVAMEFFQQVNSLEEVSDIDPFEVAEFLGSIGGFWAKTDPTFKFRNFQRSFRDVATGARTITSSVSGRMPHTRVLRKSELQNENPICDRSSQEPKKEEVLIRLFDEHGLVAVVNGTLIKTFLKSEFNATPLENGATEPALKELLPANTYLVVVPPGRTSTTIAKDVASYCDLGGDNFQTFHPRPIAVKAKKVHCSAVQAHALSISEYVGASDEVCIESDVDLGEARRFFALPKRTPSTQHPLEAEVPQRKVYPRCESCCAEFSLDTEGCSKT